MDLGATICTPKQARLHPLPARRALRRPARAGTMERFPVKLAKKAKPLRRGAAFVAVRPADGAVWLRRRPASGMLGGMAEPPTTDWSSRRDGATGAGRRALRRRLDAAPASVAHGFTHFDLELEVWRGAVDARSAGRGLVVRPERHRRRGPADPDAQGARARRAGDRRTPTRERNRTMIDHIVFDIGRVLIHYDPEIPFRRLIPDEAERTRFLAEVCTPDWNLEQDRGRTLGGGRGRG